MNRTAINILCIIFITVLAGSLIEPGLVFSNAFISGMKDGMEASSYEKDTDLPIVPIEVVMNSGLDYSELHRDTIQTDDGKQLVLNIRRASLQVPEHKYSIGLMITVAVSYICMAAAFIFLILQLIKFSIKINRGIIFDRRNASHLNKIGVSLLLIAVLEIIPGLCEDSVISSMNISIHGYGLTSYWTIPWSEFLLGIMSLMMGRIWMRGISLKEDQELTI